MDYLVDQVDPWMVVSSSHLVRHRIEVVAAVNSLDMDMDYPDMDYDIHYDKDYGMDCCIDYGTLDYSIAVPAVQIVASYLLALTYIVCYVWAIVLYL